MTKRRTPLQALWHSARAWSCADGRIRVTPIWREKPGVLTRFYARRQLQKLIDRELGGRK